MLALMSLPVAAAAGTATTASRMNSHRTTPLDRKIDMLLLLCHCQCCCARHDVARRGLPVTFGWSSRQPGEHDRCVVYSSQCSLPPCSARPWRHEPRTHCYCARIIDGWNTGVIRARPANGGLASLSTWWINERVTYVKALSVHRANASIGAMHGWIVIVSACC